MGSFDLRCALSGLSVHSRSYPDRFACSLMLLEQVGGRWVPFTPPVSARYDHYGCIDDPVDDDAVIAESVELVLELLWEAGQLTSTFPDGLARLIETGESIPHLRHVVDSHYNQFAVTHAGARVVACLFRDDVARAIAASVTPRDEPVTLDDMFGEPPPETADVLDRLRRVLRWVEPRGGLRPILANGFTDGDGDQHDAEDFARLAQDAWDTGDSILRAFVGAWHRSDVAIAAARRAETLPIDVMEAERFGPGELDIATIAAVMRTNGTSDTEIATLVTAIERAPDRPRLWRLLRAERIAMPAVLAITDGTASVRGETLVITGDDGEPRTYDTAGRRLRVADGDRIAAGQQLTDGVIEIRDVNEILGNRTALDRLSAEAAELIGLPATSVAPLIMPMLGHVRVSQTGHRVTVDAWSSWMDFERDVTIYADSLVTGYPTLARHRDPTLDEVLAEARRRVDAEFADDRPDPKRFYLVTLRTD